jgi:hypothetical protein
MHIKTHATTTIAAATTTTSTSPSQFTFLLQKAWLFGDTFKTTHSQNYSICIYTASYLRVNEQRNILHEIRKRKAKCIGHILCGNCLLKQVIIGKIKGEIEVKRSWGRRYKKQLDDLKDRRGYSHLKEEVLDRTMWRSCFGRGFGPVIRQNTEWMKCIYVLFLSLWVLLSLIVAL